MNNQDYKNEQLTEQIDNNIYTPKKRNPFYKTTTFILAASLGLSLIGGYGGATLSNLNNTSNKTVITQSTNTSLTNTSQSTSQTSISDIAEEALKTVVEITTESVTTNQFMQQYISSGAGSGVIISNDGYIVTNNHVIEGASNITVTDYEGNEYVGKLIGTDEKTDLAVIKIEANNLNAATFGQSSSLKVGDLAIAIGNPLGELGGTVTTGIISALDREIQIDNETMTLLQTNAAINPGNSGGGLFNANGELIGIVNAKSTGESVEGLGFAIPSDIAISVIQELIDNGYVSGRAYLGVSLKESTYRTNRQTTTTVYIASVENNSAASKAGLETGDQIISIENTEVATVDEVQTIINQHKSGDTVTITIIRNNKQQNVNVTLGEKVPTSNN